MSSKIKQGIQTEKLYPDIKISRLLPYTNKKGETNSGCVPVTCSLYPELEGFKNGTYHEVAETLATISDTDERRLYKQSKLLSHAFSGIFKNKWREKINLLYHTGLLNIDIDDDQNPHIIDWAALRDELGKLPIMVAVWLSISKKGVTFLVRINPNKHKQTFNYLADWLEQNWNLKIDRTCSDETRQRYASDDPGAIINYDFDNIPIVEPTNEWLAQKNSEEPLPFINVIGEADNEINFINAISRVETSNKSFTFEDGSKHFYLRNIGAHCNHIGMSLEFCQEMVIKYYSEKTELSISDLLKPIVGVYTTYKEQHGTYKIINKKNSRENTVKWILIKDYLHESKNPNPSNLLQLATENDLNVPTVEWIYQKVFQELSNEFGYSKFHKISKVKIHISKKWEIRKNIVTDQLESRLLGTIDWRQINVDTIYCYINEKKNQSINKSDIISILESDWIEEYDPLFEYFSSLIYDDSEDWIEKLAQHVKCTDQNFWVIQFKKALVRSIAQGLGKEVNRFLVVLQGHKQKTGKSTFIRFLSPWPSGQYYTESKITGDQKDVMIRLSENFIWNVEELEGIHKQEMGSFKSLLSTPQIKERRPYGKYEIYKIRRVNFWASTNPTNILEDTENTRWLIFNVLDSGINWNYSKIIDINKVWAQAYHLYKTGFDYQLSQEESLKQSSINESYRIVKPEEEFLPLVFELPRSDKSGVFYTATQIANEINKRNFGRKVGAEYVGRAMRKVFGLESIKHYLDGDKQQTRGYWLQKKENPIGDF